MKDILRVMNEYKEAFEQINETYRQAESYIEENYVVGSSIYESTLSSALDTRRTALTPLMMKAKDEIAESLTKARNSLTKAVAKQPTPEMLSTIELIAKNNFSDTEKGMIIEMSKIKGNYIASKMLAAATGTEFSTPVEIILEALGTVEKITSKHWDDFCVPSNSYESRMLMHSEGYLMQIEEEINEFLTTYSQESDE